MGCREALLALFSVFSSGNFVPFCTWWWGGIPYRAVPDSAFAKIVQQLANLWKVTLGIHRKVSIASRGSLSSSSSSHYSSGSHWVLWLFGSFWGDPGGRELCVSSCLLGLSWRLDWPEGSGINCKFNEIMKNLSGVRWSRRH